MTCIIIIVIIVDRCPDHHRRAGHQGWSRDEGYEQGVCSRLLRHWSRYAQRQRQIVMFDIMYSIACFIHPFIHPSIHPSIHPPILVLIALHSLFCLPPSLLSPLAGDPHQAWAM